MFCTLLHTLKSPQNVGMIVRAHAAHAGGELIFTGQPLPWRFKKGSAAFSRSLERNINIRHIPDPDEAISYLKEKGFSIVALEIAETAHSLNDFVFPQKTALVVGNEAHGISKCFLEKCDYVVTIPQYASVGCLNVAVSAAIAMYELKRGDTPSQVRADEYI